MQYYCPGNPQRNRLFHLPRASTGRYRYSSVLMPDGRILITAGQGLFSTEYFDPTTRNTAPGMNISKERWNAAMAVLNYSAYICGGSRTDRSCERLDTNGWTKIGSMNVNEQVGHGLAMVAFKNCLYAIGIRHKRPPYGVGPSVVERYCPKIGTWQVVNCTEPSDISAVSVLDGWIYVCRSQGCGRYDGVDKWQRVAVAAMNHHRDNFVLVTLTGRLYALGGHSREGPVLSVEVYDPKEDKWTDLPSRLQNWDSKYYVTGFVLPGMHELSRIHLALAEPYLVIIVLFCKFRFG